MGPGAYGAIIGGTAEHIQNYAGELGPAAQSQRKLSRAMESKLRTGQFGGSEAQKNTAYAQAALNLQGQARQQNADIQRNLAAGNLSGGAAADATRAAVAAQQGAAAQAAGQVQASSDAQARNDYRDAIGIVDAQANRFRTQMQKQGEISWKAANAATSGMGAGGGSGVTDEDMSLLQNREGVR